MNGLELEIGPADSALFEHLMDHRIHFSGRANDPRQTGTRRFREIRRMFLDQNVRKVADTAQRRPQVVRDAVGKAVKLRNEVLQAGRAFGDRSFQPLGMGLKFALCFNQLCLRDFAVGDILGEADQPHGPSLPIELDPPAFEEPAGITVEAYESEFRKISAVRTAQGRLHIRAKIGRSSGCT